MSISILNNPASLAAQNQLGITNTMLQKSLYQLSSGSRINTGADDAAGLAVADGLAANITALTQSARNASDGVGKLQVADGALAQVTTLLNRAVTLATESANGTLSNAQRAPLQAEFASIGQEIDRIGATTNFNGQQVFQNVNANTVVGSATGVNANTSLGGAPLTSIAGTAALTTASTLLTAPHGGTFTTTSATLTQATSIAGETVSITVTTPGTGTAASYSYVAGTTGAATIAGLMGFINAQTGLTATGGATSAIVLTANGAAVNLTEAGGAVIGAGTQNAVQTASTFTVGTSNPFTYSTYGVGSGATLGSLVSAVNSDGRYSASISAGGNFTAGYGSVAEPAGLGSAPAIAEGATGTWSFGTAGAFTTGGATKTFTIQPFGAPTATTFYDQGNLTVGALMSDMQAMGLSATLNGNGSLVVADPNNTNNAPTITTPTAATTTFGTFAGGSSQASVAAATDLYLTDDSANSANTIAVTIGSLSQSNMNGASIGNDNLSTQATAQAALANISSAINDVAALRGTLGASVNRLQSATNVINNNIQNLTSAQDNIRAADIPSTVASLSKYSILEQTGVAALSQANQLQQLVLKLIQ
jgi:flagellin